MKANVLLYVLAVAAPTTHAGAVSGTGLATGPGVGVLAWEGSFDMIAYGLVVLAIAGGLLVMIREKNREAATWENFFAVVGLTILAAILALVGGLAFVVGGIWWLVERLRGRKARRRYREAPTGRRG